MVAEAPHVQTVQCLGEQAQVSAKGGRVVGGPSRRLDGGRLVEWWNELQTAGTLIVATRLHGGPPERLAPHRAVWVMRSCPGTPATSALGP